MEAKGKYKLASVKSEKEIEGWKIPLLSFILKQTKNKYDINLGELLLLMYLSYFKYIDTFTLVENSAVSNTTFATRMLNRLHKFGLVDRVNFALEPDLYDVLPEYVYMLSKAGKRLVNKIYQHLNGVEQLYEFKI